LNRVNKLFELEKASPGKLLNEVMTLYSSILQRVLRPLAVSKWSTLLAYDVNNETNHLPIGAVNFGVEFHILISELKLERTPAEEEVKHRCRSYLIELLREMQQRIPANVTQLESLADLSPSVVLGRSKPKLHQLSFLPLYSNGNLGLLEQQWDKVSVITWSNTDDVNVEDFWVEVLNLTDAAGENDFQELGMFALSLLSLPFSNASVERAFSQMNLDKVQSEK
jgi:hypothetical protein